LLPPQGWMFRKFITLKSFLKSWLIHWLMSEFYIKDGKLVSDEEWRQEIASLKNAEGKELNEVLENSIISRLPKEKFGIFFSGGVDSSFITAICKKANADFVCYTVGIKDCDDIEWAKKVSKFLDVELKIVELELKDVERLAREVIKITGKKDIITVGVGIVVLACIENADEKVFFSGLGSEEIFAGYERHEKAENINEECWKGLVQMKERDLERDVPIAVKKGVQIATPFLDKDVITSAMKIDDTRKIKGDVKKLILREISEKYLKEFAWRKKKAAQYGSGVIKALDKLTKQNGFKYKKDYLINLL